MVKMTLVYRLLAVAVFGVAACLGTLVASSEPALLTVEISNSQTGEKTTRELTMSDLKSYPVTTFETTTNWTSGVQKFTGVSLVALLESLSVTEGQLEMVAINDYSIFFDVADPSNKGALLAYLLNDEPMTARDKGPIWMVYNYDSDAEYRRETIYARSIWQLDRILISR